MIGSAKHGNDVVTEIHYLKMSNSTFVDGKICNDLTIAGAKEILRVRNILEDNKTPEGNWDSKYLSEVNIDNAAVLAYHLDTYPDFLSSLRKIKLINTLKFDATKHNFPHYSTADQSYYNDQFLAFVALGYFSAAAISE